MMMIHHSEKSESRCPVMKAYYRTVSSALQTSLLLLCLLSSLPYFLTNTCVSAFSPTVALAIRGNVSKGRRSSSTMQSTASASPYSTSRAFRFPPLSRRITSRLFGISPTPSTQSSPPSSPSSSSTSPNNLTIHVLGLSIHTTSLPLREKLSIPENEWNEVSHQLLTASNGSVSEAAVLSTCNRFEVYYTSDNPRAAMSAVTEYLADRSGIEKEVLRKVLFVLSGDDAVWHLMRVSGGLDSLVVGEGQILSQVRQCHLHTIAPTGSGGKVLSRLLNSAVAAGKRVRSETSISKGSVSVSSAAVELVEINASKDLKGLPFIDANIAVIGAGKMTKLLITHLASRGVKTITIVNRSLERAKEVTELYPEITFVLKTMNGLWDVVRYSDVVFTATACADCLISASMLKSNDLAGGRPVMLVDISVPRNVNDDCKSVPGLSLYNVDDLKCVVAQNTMNRQKEMVEAEQVLKEEARLFVSWKESLSAIPTINQMQQRAEKFRVKELKKCAKKLGGLNSEGMEAVERLSKGIVAKLLHGPLTHLRKVEGVVEKKQVLKEISAMFELKKKVI